MKKVQLWTIQISQWRYADELGIKFIDSTVKSGIKGLAPTWDMLMKYRANEMSEDEYTRLYLLRMVESRNNLTKLWSSFLKYEKMAIACYCKPDKFCHRHLLVKDVKQYLEEHGVVVELMGELKRK
jgi:uncharacterized protein YeaO (DUF488 family)